MELDSNESISNSNSESDDEPLEEHFQNVVNMLCDYLSKKLRGTNCIEILLFAQKHSCQMLAARAVEYIVANYRTVFSSDEFLELHGDQLHRVLSTLQYRAIPIKAVENAIWFWIDYSPNERRTNADKLLK